MLVFGQKKLRVVRLSTTDSVLRHVYHCTRNLGRETITISGRAERRN